MRSGRLAGEGEPARGHWVGAGVFEDCLYDLGEGDTAVGGPDAHIAVEVLVDDDGDVSFLHGFSDAGCGGVAAANVGSKNKGPAQAAGAMAPDGFAGPMSSVRRWGELMCKTRRRILGTGMRR